LHVALLACGIGPGDEVITVSHTASATGQAILLVGAIPVFVDIDPTTYTMRPELIAEAITVRTKAILPVHLYGHSADMNPVLQVSRRHGLRVIEDCAQAHGANYYGERVGSLSDIGCFSFYPTKNLGAIGDGGMIVTNDGELADKVRLLREYGWRRRYVSDEMGVNSRLDEVQAAVLRVKLRNLDAWNAARRELASRYNAVLSGTALEVPEEASWADHVYHLYVVRSSYRDQLQAHLASGGVSTGIHYPVPLHLQPAFKQFSQGPGSLPETEAAAVSILDLPMYPELPIQAVDTIGALVAQFAARLASK
jgi:dTDP-4-amino-4,6-dideoxygalactose transaminase